MTGWLSGLRVLDLTNERGILAGQMLAKLGCDVIQIEPPSGSSARKVAPFDDEGRSFFWSAYAAGKRGVVLNLEHEADRAKFLDLVATADFLIESEDPGRLAKLGVDYAALAKRNPRLIHVSITPFGSDGPKRDYADAEIILWASGGPMHPCREAGVEEGAGPPLRVCIPQAYHHAAGDAAVGAMLAHLERNESGLGQHVDISVQQSVIQAGIANIAAAAGDLTYDYVPPALRAPGQVLSLDMSGSGSRTRMTKWHSKDGLIEMHLGIGPAAGAKANALFAWMKEEGELPEAFWGWNWIEVPKLITSGVLTDDEMMEARQAVAAFVAKRTKQELFAAAVERSLALAPLQHAGDMLTSPQLAARNFFQHVIEDGVPRTLPGDYAKGPPDMMAKVRPAPTLGQHNAEIFGEARKPAPSVPAAPKRRLPLEGLKVADLAWAVAGPAIGRTLADYGATVVRVESTVYPDTARLMGPFPPGTQDIQRSALFGTYNAGKYGMVLNLNSEDGRNIIKDMARWADVFVESFAPGQMTRWGLTPEVLRADNQRLVGLSTSLMGADGPYAPFSGFGNLGAAVSGFKGYAGHKGRLPTGVSGPYTDFIAPRFALPPLLAAIERQRKTGQGCWLDVAQSEAGMQFIAQEILRGAAQGAPYAEPDTNRDAQFAPHGAFKCAGPDQWTAIAVRDDEEWKRLAELIGDDAGDPAFATLAGRKADEDRLDAIVSAWTAARDPLDVERTLQKLGIPAHKVAASADLAADPQLKARAHFVSLPHPLGGEAVFEASRYRLSGTPAQYRRCAPHFGRDTEEVLCGMLGYAPEELERLRAAGVFK